MTGLHRGLRAPTDAGLSFHDPGRHDRFPRAGLGRHRRDARRRAPPAPALPLGLAHGGKRRDPGVPRGGGIHWDPHGVARGQRAFRGDRRGDRPARDLSVQGDLRGIAPGERGRPAHPRRLPGALRTGGPDAPSRPLQRRYAARHRQAAGHRPAHPHRRDLRPDAGPGGGLPAVPPRSMTAESVLPEALRAVMDNGVPCILGTCSADGIPNSTIISQTYWVDPRHVALSFQFFSKTIRNVRENPRACLALNDISGGNVWLLDLEYEHSETEGPVFEAMDMQIEAIASLTGMAGIFKLKSADIYLVKSVTRVAIPHP